MTMTDLSWESKLAEENIKKARADEHQKTLAQIEKFRIGKSIKINITVSKEAKLEETPILIYPKDWEKLKNE